MKLDRRTFLQRTALGAAGLGAAARLGAASAPALPAYDDRAPEGYWSAVRTLYPFSRDLIYFNTGGLGPAAGPVLERTAAAAHRLQERSEHGHEQLTGARATAARFLGADPGEIAFVRNATEGNAIVAAGLGLRPGDEVIFESHAHPGGAFPWLQQKRLRGLVVKRFAPDPDDPAGNVARIAALCTGRTRVIQVSHVTAPTGIVMPVREIARLARERRAWFHVDGAQSAGMFPFSLRELGCDSYATSGHKWIGGPIETGVLFVRRERMEEVAPTLVGAYSGEIDAETGDFRLSDGAGRFEYGTRNVPAVLGLAAAMDFQAEVGRERIAARVRLLAERVRSGLAGLPGVEILTPAAAGLAAAMITFRASRLPYDQLFSRLMKERSMRCRPVSEERLNALRVSTHLFNSPAECDALIAAVAEIQRA